MSENSSLTDRQIIVIIMIMICTFSVALLRQRCGEILVLFLSAPVRSREREIPGPGDPILTWNRVICFVVSPQKTLTILCTISTSTSLI